MERLVELIQDNQAFLLQTVLGYAKLHGYVKYTSTLEEAWIGSVSGLSDALIRCIQHNASIPEIEVDQDFTDNPITHFGRIQAIKHRQRGITLEMFLGLMKYYRQAYLDLISDLIKNPKKRRLYTLWISRFFDQNEISFCKEWNDQSKEALLSELQKTNRELSNEKNKYLTIFESIPIPVILFDSENRCDNINYAAQQFLNENLYSPGYTYYSGSDKQNIEDVIPCFYEEYLAFCQSGEHEATIEKNCQSPAQGKKNINIKFHRMLDVSGKFKGTVIMFIDQTERKQIEERLRHMSYYDILTDLHNRSFYEQEISRLSTEQNNPVGIVSCDIDGLKLVNDNLGHYAGDLLIKLAGNILRSSFRESDTVFRIGGDEFLALIPFGDDETVQSICHTILRKIEQHNALNTKKPISISIGWATGQSSDILKVIKRADSRMYSNKKENHKKYNLLFFKRFEEYGKELFV